MKITYDEAKQLSTLKDRGLNFADAGQIFSGTHFTQENDRYDYPEQRFQTYGHINERMVMIAWTPTRDGIWIISMRKCNEREQKAFATRLG